MNTEKRRRRKCEEMQNKQRYDNFYDPIFISALLKRYLIKCNDTNGNPCLTSYRMGKYEQKSFRCQLEPIGQQIWLKINCQMLWINLCFYFFPQWKPLPVHDTWLSFSRNNDFSLDEIAQIVTVTLAIFAEKLSQEVSFN